MDKKQEKTNEKQEIKNSENNFSDNVESLIDNFPPEIIKQSLTIASVIQNSPENAISEKITQEHITQYLESSHKNMELSYKDKNKNRIFIVVILILVIIMIFGIMIIFKNNPNMVEKILYTAGGFVAGIIGGFGLGRSRSE